jgi:hypothetical protein
MIPSVAGSILVANRAALSDLLGEKRLRDVLAADPMHRFWGEVLAISWVELSVVEESLRAVARAVARDPFGLNGDITRLGTERSFQTVWRLLLRLTTDDALIARADVMYRRVFNVGKLEYERVGPGKAVLRLTEWDAPPAFHMHGLAVGIETMLRLSGRVGARVRYEAEGTQAIFRAQAKPLEGD